MRHVSIALAVLAVACSATAQTQTSHLSSGRHSAIVFGLHAGLIGSGEVTRDLRWGKSSLDLESGTSFGAALELRSSRLFTFGIGVDAHSIEPEYLDSKTMLDAGFFLKLSARDFTRKVLVRPWAGISYGYVPEFDYGIDASHYAVLKGGLEIDIFPDYRGMGLKFDVAFITSVYGRIGDDDVSTGLRPLIRAGLVIR